jgi:SAM-dependent methyltransferase
MPFEKDLWMLERHYAALFEAHGDTVDASQQRDLATQELRMQRLCEIGDLSRSKILDFGCGSGHLLSVLRRDFAFAGSYVGYDLSERHLAAAREKYPGALFKRVNIFQENIDGPFEYVLINGVFNNRVSDNWGFLTEALRILRSAATAGIAFNCLSTYVDYQDENLFYVDPSKVFNFCKRQLSQFVCLRHDYRIRQNVLPYEFTIYVYLNR